MKLIKKIGIIGFLTSNTYLTGLFLYGIWKYGSYSLIEPVRFIINCEVVLFCVFALTLLSEYKTIYRWLIKGCVE